MAINLASKFSDKVDERFTKASQIASALSNSYKFEGVDTVKVYSVPVVPMADYNRNGSNSRYGTASNLAPSVQTMTVTKDRSFTFTIDRGDRIQSMMVLEAGKALRRQIDEVICPEFDTYVFATLAAKAQEFGNYSTTAITKDNAYACFLAGQETLGNNNIPDEGRICYATYAYANLLMQDPAFIKEGDASQNMTIKGFVGTVDGCKIVKVPSSRLPAGCAFLITHPIAAVAPKQLEDYKINLSLAVA